MFGAWLHTLRPWLARWPRFVALLSLLAAFTATTTTSAALAATAALAIFSAARCDGLSLVDRWDSLIRDDRLLLLCLGFARGPLFLAFASTIARFIALTVT